MLIGARSNCATELLNETLLAAISKSGYTAMYQIAASFAILIGKKILVPTLSMHNKKPLLNEESLITCFDFCF